jgi:hypothetical protein
VQISSQRSYRATLIPKNIEADEVEMQAAQGLLPTIRLKATDAESAAAGAYWASGRPVLRIERVES